MKHYKAVEVTNSHARSFRPRWLFVPFAVPSGALRCKTAPQGAKAKVRTRRFPRFEVDLPLTLLTFWEDTPIAKAHGRCRLLGEGGLGAIVAHELYVGEVVRLELPRIARVYASVRYIHGNQYGFEFAFLDYAQRCAIRRFCAAQEQAAEGFGN